MPAWLEIRAHIGFICTFRFTLIAHRSRHTPRALSAGASQFYRHVRRSLLPPASLRHPIHEPASNPGRAAEGVWARRDAPRGASNFRPPGTTERDGTRTTRPTRFVTARAAVPPTVLELFSFRVFSPVRVPWPPFAPEAF